MAHHEEQDRQSLMLHTEAVRMIQADPALIERIQSILERWISQDPIPNPVWDEWRRILRERDWETALAVSECGNQIRQASPLGCILPEEKRLEIIWECRGGKSDISKDDWFRQMREAQERMVIAEEAFQKKAGILDSEWGQEMLANIKRMAVDEEYRKLIAKKLS